MVTDLTDCLRGINVFLIGMMGTGKTTLGKLLAQKLGYRFFDTDELIERATGQTVGEIFATAGEGAFRDLETQVLSEVAACTRSVIATGGGIVLRPKNWSYLHHGLIVWLDAPLDLLSQRLEADRTRPLLQETAPSRTLQSLLEQRHSLYAQADLQISIAASQTPQQTLTVLLEKMPTAVLPPGVSSELGVRSSELGNS